MIRNILFIVNIYLVLCDKTEGAMKLVLDNDAGADDAMAIFLSLLFEKHHNGPKLIGLTTVNGNTNEDNVHVNNMRILSVAQRQDVPIYRGSKSSLIFTPTVDDYFGKDGLGDSDDHPAGLVPAHSQDAVSALIQMSKDYPGQLVVVTLAGLTNVALAIKADPEFLERIAQLYIAAGNIHSEKHPDPEFNTHMDVEAYKVVANHSTPDKVTILPFSQVKDHCDFSITWRNEVLGRIDTGIIKAQNIYERVSLKDQEYWYALDPAAVAMVVRPDLVQEYKYSKNDVIICGDKRGIISNEFVSKEEANVRIVHSINKAEYEKFLLELFSLE